MPDLISSTSRSVVVGLGVTGLSVARYLHARGEDFCVVDTREHPPGLDTLAAEMPGVPFVTGELIQAVLDTAAELVVSPGIAPSEPWLQRAVVEGAQLIGDVDLFVREAKAPVIGITGSNAKSTVTDLVGHMAKAAGRRVAVGGNLGTPALDLLDDQVELYVLELSSFQLERAQSLSLEVATVLNLSPDHLDRHGTMQTYHQAKHRIFDGSKSVVLNSDDPLTIPPMAGNRKQISWRLREPELQGFGVRVNDEGVEILVEGFEALMPVAELGLVGRHNVANALAALAIGRAVDLPTPAMRTALRAYQGLAHRCERVARVNDVTWVNDSKATNVGAALAAIEGLGAQSRLILIAGGRDKGADFRVLKDAVSAHCDAVLLIGEASDDIASALDGVVSVQRLQNLDQAVHRAQEISVAGQTVLLSPACASFDQFASFEERGERFRSLVSEVLAA